MKKGTTTKTSNMALFWLAHAKPVIFQVENSAKLQDSLIM